MNANDVDTLFDKAANLFEQGKFKEAEQHCHSLCATHPYHAPAVSLMGAILCQTNRAKIGVKFLEKIARRRCRLGFHLRSVSPRSFRGSAELAGTELKAETEPRSHVDLVEMFPKGIDLRQNSSIQPSYDLHDFRC